MNIKFSKSSWEYTGTPSELCAQIENDGFAAVESAVQWSPIPLSEWTPLLERHHLKIITQLLPMGATPAEQKKEFEDLYLKFLELNPLFVNSQHGSDFFTEQENIDLIKHAMELEAKHGVPVYFETHRSRCISAVPATLRYLEACPGMKLTADISHFMCVHESDLSNRRELLQPIFDATHHLHARFGHTQGSQVSDPRSAEHAPLLEVYKGYWKDIIASAEKRGLETLYITPEHGPYPYATMKLDNKDEPLSNIWETNLWVRDWVKANVL